MSRLFTRDSDGSVYFDSDVLEDKDYTSEEESKVVMKLAFDYAARYEELLEEISDMCQSANYDIQEIYELCQEKIKQCDDSDF